eukprot:PhM_4_TR9199/c0_g1_i1/m.16045
MRALLLVVLVIIAIGVANAANQCSWASNNPIETTINITGVANGTRFSVGSLGAGRNLDVLCYTVVDGASCGAGLDITREVSYHQGLYTVGATPMRALGNGPDKVQWSASIVVKGRPAGCNGTVTVYVGALPSDEGACEIKANRSAGRKSIVQSLSAKHAEQVYVPMSTGRQLLLHCLQAFSNPLDPTQLTNCGNPTFKLEVVTGPQCIYATSESNRCCVISPAKNQTLCEAAGCQWSKTEDLCFEVTDAVDVTSHAFGIPYDLTFESQRSVGATSSFWDQSRVRWGLRYTQVNAAQCNAQFDINAVFTSYGGTCEREVIDSCDADLEKCMLSATELRGYDNRYCRCMSTAEKCYRAAGCQRSKRYDDLIGDCAENACGAFCSGALSLVRFSAMAMIAVVLIFVL